MVEVGKEALDLLTVTEVATRLRVSVQTVRREIWAWDKKPGTGLEAVRIGSRRLVAPEAVIAYKARLHEQGAQPRSKDDAA